MPPHYNDRISQHQVRNWDTKHHVTPMAFENAMNMEGKMNRLDDFAIRQQVDGTYVRVKQNPFTGTEMCLGPIWNGQPEDYTDDFDQYGSTAAHRQLTDPYHAEFGYYPVILNKPVDRRTGKVKIPYYRRPGMGPGLRIK
jgi:hypothetical protein